MHYWNSVLDEVLHKNDASHEFLFTNFGNLYDELTEEDVSENFLDKVKDTRDLRTYYLGKEYPDVYLTKREAECMFWVAQELTIGETALRMNLSARTVEFYVKNMKLKLRCASKKILIEKVLQSNLLQQLEQDGLHIIKH